MAKRNKRENSSTPLSEQLLEISNNHKKKLFFTQRMVEFSILLIVVLIGSVATMIYFFLQEMEQMESSNQKIIASTISPKDINALKSAVEDMKTRMGNQNVIIQERLDKLEGTQATLSRKTENLLIIVDKKIEDLTREQKAKLSELEKQLSEKIAGDNENGSNSKIDKQIKIIATQASKSIKERKLLQSEIEELKSKLNETDSIQAQINNINKYLDQLKALQRSIENDESADASPESPAREEKKSFFDNFTKKGN